MIALFNTVLTAIFLLILPLWQMELPYTRALITLTFVAGLIPIVGNLLCNVVLTIVGLSVSPLRQRWPAWVFGLIHKAEYVINAKVVDSVRTLACVGAAGRDVHGRSRLRPSRTGRRAAAVRLPEKNCTPPSWCDLWAQSTAARNAKVTNLWAMLCIGVLMHIKPNNRPLLQEDTL